MSNPRPNALSCLALIAGQVWLTPAPESSDREILRTGMSSDGAFVEYRYLPGGKVRYAGQAVRTKRSAFLGWVYLRRAEVKVC